MQNYTIETKLQLKIKVLGAMDLEKIKKAVIVASLFHDIGKFWQRAVHGNEGLSSSTLNLEGDLCPELGKYRHVLWTSEFFELFGNVFPINVSEQLTSDPLDNVKNLSARHHKPLTPLHYIIQQADWLSSGMDRTRAEDIKDEEVGAFRKKRLISIFSYVKEKGESKENWVYKLTSLEPTEDVFPVVERESYDLTDEYKNLWDRFIAEFKNSSVLSNNFNIWIGAVLGLLEKYTWCIPSSTRDLPDVSLYDHLKTTSAIALALVLYHHGKNTLNSTEAIKNREEKKFLFVIGDLSGIQDFIYSLSATNVKGASKILRARSFYLQAIGEAAVHYVLDKLGLAPVSVIMNAGGRFIVLAPNLEDVKYKLREIEIEIANWLFDEFNAKISLNITYDVEVSGSELMMGNFENVLGSIQISAERKKRKKFLEVLKSGQSFILDRLYDELRKNGHCKFCGENPAVETIPDETGKAVEICKQCKTFQALGKWLTEVDAISYTANNPSNTGRNIKLFGNVYLNLHKIKEINITSDYYYLELFKREEGFVYPVKFLANYVPVWRKEDEIIFDYVHEIEQTFKDALGRVKTFGELAELGVIYSANGKIEKEGKAMIGILKADVDNLGQIFSGKFAKNLSISKYVTLSRSFDFYFAGYLNHLLETKYRNIYVIYSGGDDLVLVGEWKEIIQVAEEVYGKFREFTTWNKNITLSAGIALIGPKYPINRGILMADEFLEKSKQNKDGAKSKDSLTIFNTTIRWEFLPKLWEWRNYFEKWLTSKESKVKTTFMHRLLKYQMMAREYYENRDPNGLRFTYLLKYDVARNLIERKNGKIVKGREEMEKLFELVENNLKEEYKKLWLTLNIPIFYVLYKYRGKKLKGGD